MVNPLLLYPQKPIKNKGEKIIKSNNIIFRRSKKEAIEFPSKEPLTDDL